MSWASTQSQQSRSPGEITTTTNITLTCTRHECEKCSVFDWTDGGTNTDILRSHLRCLCAYISLKFLPSNTATNRKNPKAETSLSNFNTWTCNITKRLFLLLQKLWPRSSTKTEPIRSFWSLILCQRCSNPVTTGTVNQKSQTANKITLVQRWAHHTLII